MKVTKLLPMSRPIAAYGAGDLAQANTLYLDSHWGIGASYRELLHGIDCPLNAAYMDTVTWYKGNERPVFHKNSVCVFEMDLGESRGWRRGLKGRNVIVTCKAGSFCLICLFFYLLYLHIGTSVWCVYK